MANQGMSSQCSHNVQENNCSRTCLDTANRPCVKLFGVNLLDQISKEKTNKKSVSLEDPQCSSNSFNGVYKHKSLSENQITSQHLKSTRSIKKSRKWTEEEHIKFLAGIEKLGKGNWKRISEEFVTTKTSTQIASHAQKYFLRLSSTYKRTPKSSVFNISLNKSADASTHMTPLSNSAPQSSKAVTQGTETRNQLQNVYMIYQPIIHQAPQLSINVQQPLVFQAANQINLPIGLPIGSISALPLSWAMPNSSVKPDQASSSSSTSTDSPMPLPDGEASSST